MPRWLRLFERLLPTLLMAASVSLLTVGLLAYAPATFGEWRTPGPSLGGGDPLFSPAATATPLALPATPRPTRPPLAAVATRIRIPSLDIDLPVVAGDLQVPGNRDLYPLCHVALYMPDFGQPGDAGTTYIYAHAQRGMFLPLLRASQHDPDKSLVGALVEVYTSDALLHVYEIDTVKPHATDLSLATEATREQLVLQTSEGPSGTIPKLQVAARPVSVVPSTPEQALPSPQPRVCLPD